MAIQNPADLLATLAGSKALKANDAAYQVIVRLIGLIGRNQQQLTDQITVNTNGLDSSILTFQDSPNLPNSRKLVAGTNITLDDSVAGEEIISASGGGTTQQVSGAVFIRDNEFDEGFVIPGPQGAQGIQGNTGPAGSSVGIIGIPGIDGEDGQDSYIPGPQGPSGAAGGGAFSKISEQTPSGVATVTFSIPAGYTHLKIFYSARGTQSATATVLTAQLNGDTGNNYYRQRLSASGGSSVATESLGVGNIDQIGVAAAATAPLADCGVGEITFYDVSGTTFHKQGEAKMSWQTATSSGGMSVQIMGFAWANTAALTSIAISIQTGNYVAGTKFSLYGLS